MEGLSKVALRPRNLNFTVLSLQECKEFEAKYGGIFTDSSTRNENEWNEQTNLKS